MVIWGRKTNLKISNARRSHNANSIPFLMKQSGILPTNIHLKIIPVCAVM